MHLTRSQAQNQLFVDDTIPVVGRIVIQSTSNAGHNIGGCNITAKNYKISSKQIKGFSNESSMGQARLSYTFIFSAKVPKDVWKSNSQKQYFLQSGVCETLTSAQYKPELDSCCRCTTNCKRFLLAYDFYKNPTFTNHLSIDILSTILSHKLFFKIVNKFAKCLLEKQREDNVSTFVVQMMRFNKTQFHSFVYERQGFCTLLKMEFVVATTKNMQHIATQDNTTIFRTLRLICQFVVV